MSEFDVTCQISFEPFGDDTRLREVQNSEASGTDPLRPPAQRGRSHRPERACVGLQKKLRARHGQPAGHSDGEIGEAAQIALDWDPIVADTGMSGNESGNGCPCIVDRFETQAHSAARVLTCKRMVGSVHANAAAVEVIEVPFSNANAPDAAMLHDGTSFAFEDVEQQAKIPAVRHDLPKSDPRVRDSGDSFEGMTQLSHRRQNIADGVDA